MKGAKLLLALYEYVGEIKNAPAFVEELTCELSAVNTGLQQVKILVTASADKSAITGADDAKIVIERCSKTFQEIEAMVENSKIETKSSSKGQIILCIKWDWSRKKVVGLRERLERYKTSIELMLQTLNGSVLQQT
jgi:Fungal N-terminal domain of STAND proteins